MLDVNQKLETITIAGGCFWCTEAIFKRIHGVISVIPGYSGGTLENPTYEQVCAGTTGHAETIQVEFDPKVIELKTLLEVFFKLHDPTTINRQGADVGTQYRSAIFYGDDKQMKIAKKVRDEIDKSGLYDSRVVTAIVPFENFYKAENYHKDYYKNNKTAPYCQIVIDPKIKKLFTNFELLTK